MPGSSGVVSRPFALRRSRVIEEKLGRVEASRCRAVVARAYCSVVDHLDLQLVVKEACRGMAAPGAPYLRRVKRIARYFQAVPRAVITTGAEIEVERAFIAYADSGYAGCRCSRESSSGGASTVGGIAVKTWRPASGCIWEAPQASASVLVFVCQTVSIGGLLHATLDKKRSGAKPAQILHDPPPHRPA